MKHKIYYLLLPIMILSSGCKSKALKLTDLKFADFEKEAIARNKVDTVFLIFPADSAMDKETRANTFNYETYDKADNMLCKLQKEANSFGYEVRYFYDGNGLINRKEFSNCLPVETHVTYQFIPDSFLLKQIWVEEIDTFIFKFDSTGKLLEQTEYEASQIEGRVGENLETIYEYNSPGLLRRKTVNCINFEKWNSQHHLAEGVLLSPQNITDYFYTNNKIDSSVKTTYYPTQPDCNFRRKIFYDSNGLRSKMVDRDSIVTTYVYKKRMD